MQFNLVLSLGLGTGELGGLVVVVGQVYIYIYIKGDRGEKLEGAMAFWGNSTGTAEWGKWR